MHLNLSKLKFNFLQTTPDEKMCQNEGRRTATPPGTVRVPSRPTDCSYQANVSAFCLSFLKMGKSYLDWFIFITICTARLLQKLERCVCDWGGDMEWRLGLVVKRDLAFDKSSNKGRGRPTSPVSRGCATGVVSSVTL
jgi:hypothetical protein